MRYARDVVRDVVVYRLNRMGFGTHTWVPASDEYDFKEGEGTSHTALLEMLSDAPSKRILDLGCSGGRLAERLRKLGYHVTGVDGVLVVTIWPVSSSTATTSVNVPPVSTPMRIRRPSMTPS